MKPAKRGSLLRKRNLSIPAICIFLLAQGLMVSIGTGGPPTPVQKGSGSLRPVYHELVQGARRSLGELLPILTYVESRGEMETLFWYRKLALYVPICSYLYPGLETGEAVAEEEDTTVRFLTTKEEAGKAANGSEQVIEEKQSSFVPHKKLTEVDVEGLRQFDQLLEYYTVDAGTYVNDDLLDVTYFMQKSMKVDKTTEGPQILIFHTHSKEAFADSLKEDPDTSIVGMGEYLGELLTDRYGFQVLHVTDCFDEDRDRAYAKALPVIEKVLAENPSIQLVIDLHRDALPEQMKSIVTLDGRPTAQIMFFNGLSRTKRSGELAYLYNKNLKDELALSFRMQLAAEEYYPGFARKIYLKGYRYNMHLKDKYLLVELGAQNNTVEEARNACEPLAHLISLVTE